MLYPRENRARAVMNLDGEWSFCLDDGTGLTRHWERGPLKNAERIAVPASYNDQKDKREYRNHCGWVFYQRQVTVPAFYRGQRLFLRMDAVTNNALVWLDGSLICEHRGGFLPFEVEITDRVLPGEAALLTIAADNRISHSTLPVGNEGTTAFFGSDNPGVPSVEAAKKWRGQQNAPNFDFFNYAGINRPVRIYTTPQRYIRDLELVPGVDGGDGLVRYRVETGGDMEESGGCSRQPGNAECGEQDGNCKTASGAGRTVDQAGSVQIEILDAQGSIVARAVGPSGEIRIPRARRWQPRPGIPYLYTARVIYGEDVYEQTFGIRTVDDSREGVERFLRRNPTTSVVAVQNGRIIGNILCGHDGRTGYFYHVCVANGYFFMSLYAFCAALAPPVSAVCAAGALPGFACRDAP